MYSFDIKAYLIDCFDIFNDAIKVPHSDRSIPKAGKNTVMERLRISENINDNLRGYSTGFSMRDGKPKTNSLLFIKADQPYSSYLQNRFAYTENRNKKKVK